MCRVDRCFRGLTLACCGFLVLFRVSHIDASNFYRLGSTVNRCECVQILKGIGEGRSCEAGQRVPRCYNETCLVSCLRPWVERCEQVVVVVGFSMPVVFRMIAWTTTHVMSVASQNLFGIGGSGVACGCFSTLRSKGAGGTFKQCFQAPLRHARNPSQERVNRVVKLRFFARGLTQGCARCGALCARSGAWRPFWCCGPRARANSYLGAPAVVAALHCWQHVPVRPEARSSRTGEECS